MQKGKLLEQITSIIEETTQGADFIKVSHDIQLTDNDGTSRQIDVLIEYKQNDRFTFRTIIECKHKSRDAIEINQMNAFLAMFQNLPDIHQAIFVSSNGFQKSARTVAQRNNILMYTLEEFANKDFEKLFNAPPSIKKSESSFLIKNWRILIDIKNEKLLKGINMNNISPEQILVKDNIQISVRNIVNEFVPHLSEKAFKDILNKSRKGIDINGKIFNQTFVIPLETNFFAKFDTKEIPVEFIEIELDFWITHSEELFETVKVYKDENDKKISVVALGKVIYDNTQMFLSLVYDIEKNNTEFYLIDGKNKKTKLEIDEILSDKTGNRKHFTIKKPNI